MLVESEDGATWTAPRPLGDPAAPSAQPDIAVTKGVFHLVWQDFRTSQPHLYYGARGRGFAPPTRRLSQTAGVRSPFIDARGDRLLAAWESQPGAGGPDVYAALGDANTRDWSNPAPLTSGAAQSARPTGAVWDEGAIVVWQDGRAGRFDLYAAQLQPDGSWSAAAALVESAFPSTMPSIAQPYDLPGGQAQLIWMENSALVHSARDPLPPDTPSQPRHFDLSANDGWDDDGTLLFRWKETPEAHAYEAAAAIDSGDPETFMLTEPALALKAAEGVVEVAVSAIDAVGNRSAPSPRAAVRVDANPPKARFFRPVEGERLIMDGTALFSCEDVTPEKLRS